MSGIREADKKEHRLYLTTHFDIMKGSEPQDKWRIDTTTVIPGVTVTRHRLPRFMRRKDAAKVMYDMASALIVDGHDVMLFYHGDHITLDRLARMSH